MVQVYSVALVVGVIGLVVLLFLESMGKKLGSRRLGAMSAVGALTAFGMGGLVAEFSPLDIGWQLALVIAVAAAGLAILWVRYADSQSRSS